MPTSYDQGDFFRDTLAEAKAKIAAEMDDGLSCPCCGRFVKRYRRRIYAAQARQLITLYRLGRRRGWDEYFHRNNIMTRELNNNDVVLLRYWELIQVRPNEDPTKKDSGFYRITDLGRAFVELKHRVPKYLVMYNDAAEGFEGELVSIVDALGKKFDYRELMEGTW